MQDAEKRSLFWPEDDCEFCPGKLFCLNFIQTIGGLPVRLVLRICLDKRGAPCQSVHSYATPISDDFFKRHYSELLWDVSTGRLADGDVLRLMLSSRQNHG